MTDLEIAFPGFALSVQIFQPFSEDVNMHMNPSGNYQSKTSTPRPTDQTSSPGDAIKGVAWIAMVGLLSWAQTAVPQTPVHTPHPILLPEANRPPDANDQMEMREKQAKKLNFDAANGERLRQISKESEDLITLAMALKAEVDSTPNDKLSPNVVRKADTIEKLAHSVAQKMKLTVGAD